MYCEIGVFLYADISTFVLSLGGWPKKGPPQNRYKDLRVLEELAAKNIKDEISRSLYAH